MKHENALLRAVVGLMLGLLLASSGHAQSEQKPVVKVPESGVPQIMTLEGTFVRAAYNREGYAILGYHVANLSIGEEWMLLDFGVTLREGVSNYTLTRDAVSLETPDANTLPLPSVEDTAAPACRRSSSVRGCLATDQLLPAERQPCVPHRLFQRVGRSSHALGPRGAEQQPRLPRPPLLQGARRDCLRPALAQREVREERRPRAVQDLTKDEEKLLSKNYKDIRKQVQEAFKPKK